MPTKTIYVADADLPIFDRAQALAGDNLSATIVQALRRFVQARDPAQGTFAEIAVQVGDNGTYVTRRFYGRALARRQIRDRERSLATVQTVYETAKSHFALHTATRPDWAAWSSNRGRHRRRDRRDLGPPGAEDQRGGWRDFDWGAFGESSAFHLDVYDTVDELRQHIPPELFNAVDDALRGPDAEFLDI